VCSSFRSGSKSTLHAKLQELSLPERKLDLNVMVTDHPSSAANGNIDLQPNEQNVNVSTTACGLRQPNSRTSQKFKCASFPLFSFYISLTFDWTRDQRQRMTSGPAFSSFQHCAFQVQHLANIDHLCFTNIDHLHLANIDCCCLKLLTSISTLH